MILKNLKKIIKNSRIILMTTKAEKNILNSNLIKVILYFLEEKVLGAK